MISYEQLRSRQIPIAVVGLGYVGLPLAVALSRHFDVVGFDVSPARVAELDQGRDSTGEVAADDLRSSNVKYTSDPQSLSAAGLIIVAVPTPIDEHRRPDLKPIIKASITVGSQLVSGSVVVYESTVYPGLTEDSCIPILEEYSGLKNGEDFWVGYSPERINPGDKVHTLKTIVKVVAGQNEEVADLLEKVYGQVVEAGIHKASSIKVAEAAKVIENTQRDLNIALMNELALIFQRLGIDTLEVLEAAGSKWNFLPFRPGLVGGHCIGVDPYYLTFKAEALGHHPQVILAGRRINDGMGQFIAQTAIKKFLQRDCGVNKDLCVGVLGLTFKENVPDLRNTKVIDIIRELQDFNLHVKVHDPLADTEEAQQEYGLHLCPWKEMQDLDGIILAVPHEQYQQLGPSEFASLFRNPEQGILMDVKGSLPASIVHEANWEYWRL